MAIKINLEKVLKENNMTSKELCKKDRHNRSKSFHFAKRKSKRCPIYNHQ